MTDRRPIADYHLHSAFSDDSEAPMEDMVRQAVSLGLDEICFTEHVDYGVKTDTNCNYPAYFNELERVRAQYGDRIAVRRGIEVNTSSFRYGLPDLTSSREILALYHQLGGRILTIGSDAHSPEQLGDHIPEVRAVLRDIGFREFCTFERMQPIFHPL